MYIFFDIIILFIFEKILLETIDSFVVNSDYCEPPCKKTK